MNTTQTLDALRAQIKALHASGQIVHVSISNSHPKVSLIDVPVRIRFASAQLFGIEREDKQTLFCNSFQYADLLTHRIDIQELKEI